MAKVRSAIVSSSLLLSSQSVPPSSLLSVNHPSSSSALKLKVPTCGSAGSVGVLSAVLRGIHRSSGRYSACPLSAIKWTSMMPCAVSGLSGALPDVGGQWKSPYNLNARTMSLPRRNCPALVLVVRLVGKMAGQEGLLASENPATRLVLASCGVRDPLGACSLFMRTIAPSQSSCNNCVCGLQ